jgi:hypothetical protein
LLGVEFQRRADEIHAVLPQGDPFALLVFGYLKGALPLAVGSVPGTLLSVNFKIPEISSKWCLRTSEGKRSREGFDASLQSLQEGREVLNKLRVVKHDTQDSGGSLSQRQSGEDFADKAHP